METGQVGQGCSHTLFGMPNPWTTAGTQETNFDWIKAVKIKVVGYLYKSHSKYPFPRLANRTETNSAQKLWGCSGSRTCISALTSSCILVELTKKSQFQAQKYIWRFSPSAGTMEAIFSQLLRFWLKKYNEKIPGAHVYGQINQYRCKMFSLEVESQKPHLHFLYSRILLEKARIASTGMKEEGVSLLVLLSWMKYFKLIISVIRRFVHILFTNYNC